jgi:hypothetical protein
MEGFKMIDCELFIRPSEVKRLAICNGAAQMQAAHVNRYGAPETAPVAAVGTSINEWVDHGVALWKAGQEWGDAIADACNNAAASGLNRWDTNCVQTCLEFYRDLITKEEIDPENVLTQHALDMVGFGFTRKGTADLILVVPFREIFIVDLKAGFLDQGDADEHDQIAAYGVAGAETFSVKKVTVMLFQPRNEKSRRITAGLFEADALRETAEWVREVTEFARFPHAEVVASYTGCNYCKALTTCPVARKYAMKVSEILASPIGPQTSADYGDLANRSKIAEKLGKEGVDVVKKRIAGGGEADGWQLAPSGSTTTLIDGEGALKVLADEHKMKDAVPAIGLSMPKLKECLGEDWTRKYLSQFFKTEDKAKSLKPR